MKNTMLKFWIRGRAGMLVTSNNNILCYTSCCGADNYDMVESGI